MSVYLWSNESNWCRWCLPRLAKCHRRLIPTLLTKWTTLSSRYRWFWSRWSVCPAVPRRRDVLEHRNSSWSTCLEEELAERIESTEGNWLCLSQSTCVMYDEFTLQIPTPRTSEKGSRESPNDETDVSGFPRCRYPRSCRVSQRPDIDHLERRLKNEWNDRKSLLGLNLTSDTSWFRWLIGVRIELRSAALKIITCPRKVPNERKTRFVSVSRSSNRLSFRRQCFVHLENIHKHAVTCRKLWIEAFVVRSMTKFELSYHRWRCRSRVSSDEYTNPTFLLRRDLEPQHGCDHLSRFHRSLLHGFQRRCDALASQLGSMFGLRSVDHGNRAWRSYSSIRRSWSVSWNPCPKGSLCRLCHPWRNPNERIDYLQWSSRVLLCLGRGWWRTTVPRGLCPLVVLNSSESRYRSRHPHPRWCNCRLFCQTRRTFDSACPACRHSCRRCPVSMSFPHRLVSRIWYVSLRQWRTVRSDEDSSVDRRSYRCDPWRRRTEMLEKKTEGLFQPLWCEFLSFLPIPDDDHAIVVQPDRCQSFSIL